MTADVRSRLTTITDMAEAATAGPWSLDGAEDEVKMLCGPIYIDGTLVRSEYLAECIEHDADAEFIAASRTVVPQLAAALNAVLDFCDQAEQPNTASSGYVMPTSLPIDDIRSAVAAHLEDQP